MISTYEEKCNTSIPVDFIVTRKPVRPILDIPNIQNHNDLVIHSNMKNDERIHVSINENNFLYYEKDLASNLLRVSEDDEQVDLNCIELKEGLSTFSEKNTDYLSESETVKYDIIVDSISPELYIDGYHGANLKCESNTYRLSRSISEDVIKFTVNGIETLIGKFEPNFAIDLELKIGENAVIIEALDYVGNETVMRINIVHE